ncbi:HD domain-containing phosphohydrolase [Peredibacter starrii]|uniref:HD domain-containing phosphohydrolase n=1 Tax=Peredibacter starrii TaxID=28202 RepID=A0AAX4HL23_9BACT|nr:HD domain-containing phosphohydrolase [Peredibacter starrii]WPU63972.1 HD domain-containing phosphohydrolase [Peredibacter starrii]
MKVLISDPDNTYIIKIEELLKKEGIDFELCQSGKECQLKVYKGGIKVLIMDLETENYSALMVLKFMRLNHPTVQVILTVKSKETLKELELDSEGLKKLGVSQILVKPYTCEKLLNAVRGEQLDRWKNVTLTNGSSDEEAVINEKDENFTKVSIESCMSGNVTIFDHYLRLGPGRYIKILRRGDHFDNERIEKYKTEKKVVSLYFKTVERAVYVNFMNELLNKMLTKKSSSPNQYFSSIKAVSEVYIDEIFLTGIRPSLVEEGMKICQNMYKLVNSNLEISNFLRQYQNEIPSEQSHQFLVSFFSTIICKNLEWSSQRTVEIIALGGLLHDIGKLKLPKGMRDKEETDIPENQRAIFREHPLHGYEMLSKSPFITTPVKQIVYQHHELVNGTGYPNGLTGAKIYPLAKVVSLADGFVRLLTKNKCTTIEGLKIFIPDKNETTKYDPLILKSLVTGLLK